MGKLILLALIGFIVYWILKSYARNAQLPQNQQPPVAGAEDMVRCAHCSVNLPKSESILSRGDFFCCDEHRRAHQK